MKIILYLCHLGPIGKLPVERERSWVNTLSEAGTQNLVYFVKFATFFTWDIFGNWCPSENIQRIDELVQNRAFSPFSLRNIFGLFFIRNVWWSNIRIKFAELSNILVGQGTYPRLSPLRLPLVLHYLRSRNLILSGLNWMSGIERLAGLFWKNNLACSRRNTASGCIYLVTLSCALSRR